MRQPSFSQQIVGNKLSRERDSPRFRRVRNAGCAIQSLFLKKIRISRLKFVKFQEYFKNKPEAEVLKGI